MRSQDENRKEGQGYSALRVQAGVAGVTMHGTAIPANEGVFPFLVEFLRVIIKLVLDLAEEPIREEHLGALIIGRALPVHILALRKSPLQSLCLLVEMGEP